jgi:hypothetical protein
MELFLRSIGIVASFFASTAACSNDMSGQWTLSVENPGNHVVATLKVEFTNEKEAALSSHGEPTTGLAYRFES